MATTRHMEIEVEARANAQLGLMIALGHIQEQTGPDQRITATAAALENVIGEPAHPHWVGVWKSAQWDENSPTATPDKDDLFNRWLVSLPTGADNESLAAPHDLIPDETWSIMVGPGSLGPDADASDIVYAGKESVLNGHFAYWVGDESVKARYNLTEKGSSFDPQIRQALNFASPPQWGIDAVGNDIDDIFALEYDPTNNELKNLLSSSIVGMTASNSANATLLQHAYNRHYHDLSLSSVGLLTNARDGGLKQDLSMAFELEDTAFNAHPDFSVGSAGWDSLYTDTNPDQQPVKHLWVYKSEDPEEPQGHYKGPTWHLLRDYYRLYRELDNPTSSPLLKARNALPLPERNSNNLSIANLYNNGQRSYNTGYSGSRSLIRPRSLKVAPVLARIQLVFSLTAVPIDPTTVVRPASVSNGAGAYKLRLIVDPIVTLYNPYTTSLWFQGVTVRIPNIVESLRWELNGVESNTMSVEELFALSHPEYSVSRALGDFVFGVMSIADPDGITLAPGEVRVYSAGNNSPVPYTDAIDAVEGWPSSGGFYVDTLDPAPRETDWTANKITKQYYDHELDGDVKNVIIGTGSDQIAVSFEALLDDDENVKWVSRLGHTNSEKQMGINAYLVAEGSYNDRFRVTQTNADIFLADKIQHYTVLRANLGFGSSSTMGDIGRLPDANGAYSFSSLAGFKQSLGQIDIRLKTEDDTIRPYPAFGLSSMNAFQTNQQSASSGDYGVLNPPFAAVRTPLSDVVLAVQFDPDTLRGFWGPSRNFTFDSTSFVAGTEIPKAPLTSLGQLQHVDTAIYGYESSHAIGNSFATPWIKLNEIEETDRANIDTSYLANNAIWDGYFFSSITDQTSSVFGGSKRTIAAVIEDFTGASSVPLPNSRMVLIGRQSQDMKDALLDSSDEILDDAHRESAAFLGVDGAFNVNSTSVEAWKSLYGCLGAGDLYKINQEGNLTKVNNTDDHRISRFTLPLADASSKWAGYSSLTDDEIQRLAEETVIQVKKRGPFLSMAEFVNRNISSNPELAKSGALQTAINDSGINDTSRTINSAEITGYIENSNAKVPTDLGAAGFLTQADLLTMLGASMTVRGDTFTIRAYGDVTDPLTNEVTATAWCEAIVQRIPDYVNRESDAPTVEPADLTDTENQEFGRRYKIIAFRWLSEDEV
ncbi:hypothetical protein [Cerasicoccus frondis]|uniref:hypothetical protein n=1 Tax=Cerasicoccus frondis TaxID=490090 RepID=UPI002852D7CA|nr:hypothetical protein [Cerasicoccus frondis]